MRNNFQISKHFNLIEFESPDTGAVILYSELIERLERLRALVNKPIIITSGYRTLAYNKRVGGEPNSFHLRGMACDVKWLGIEQRRAIALAERAGFEGIGSYPDLGIIHVDVRGYRARWTKIAGRYV